MIFSCFIEDNERKDINKFIQQRELSFVSDKTAGNVL